MSWYLEAYQRHGDAFVAEFRLPAWVDDNTVEKLIGTFPDLNSSSFPVSEFALAELAKQADISIDRDNCEYFLQYRDD